MKKFSSNIAADITACSDDLTDIMMTGMKNTHTNRYIPRFFFRNGIDGENLCSFEVVYRSISFSTRIEKFVLIVCTYPMTCSTAITAIIMAGMKNTRPNRYRYIYPSWSFCKWMRRWKMCSSEVVYPLFQY